MAEGPLPLREPFLIRQIHVLIHDSEKAFKLLGFWLTGSKSLADQKARLKIRINLHGFQRGPFVMRMAPDVSQFQPKVYFYSSSCDYYFSTIFLSLSK